MGRFKSNCLYEYLLRHFGVSGKVQIKEFVMKEGIVAKCVGTICFNFMFNVYFMVCLRTVQVHQRTRWFRQK